MIAQYRFLAQWVRRRRTFGVRPFDFGQGALSLSKGGGCLLLRRSRLTPFPLAQPHWYQRSE